MTYQQSLKVSRRVSIIEQENMTVEHMSTHMACLYISFA